MRVSDVTKLFLLATLWGGSFLFMRMAAPVLGPVWLIEMRVLLAGLALLSLLIRLNLWSYCAVSSRPCPIFDGNRLYSLLSTDSKCRSN